MEIVLVWFLWTGYDGTYGKHLTQQPAQYPSHAECNRTAETVKQNTYKYGYWVCAESKVLVNKK